MYARAVPAWSTSATEEASVIRFTSVVGSWLVTSVMLPGTAKASVVR